MMKKTLKIGGSEDIKAPMFCAKIIRTVNYAPEPVYFCGHSQCSNILGILAFCCILLFSQLFLPKKYIYQLKVLSTSASQSKHYVH